MNPVNTHEHQQFNAKTLQAARLSADAERLATAIVGSQLRGLFADAQGACSKADVMATLRPSHARWMDATLRHLERHGLVTTDEKTQRSHFSAGEPIDALWRRWHDAMQKWGGNANHRAYLALIEVCLRSLAEILAGTVPATDVMFPESSMHLVEGIYKHNLIADHFNHVLGESLRAEFEKKTAHGEGEMRLLEIGAGTGGTTAALLPMLHRFGKLIGEYCYTDLSKAFLLHAEEVYKPQFPALKSAIFDVGKPLSLQSIEGNQYDAVIATNVLHATSNMRESVRNAKALLKRGGLLLVNEISEWSWHTHFTFGLLEGWWLYEDESLRLPGSPALSAKQWGNLLKMEGFVDICFPASEQHGLGQLIVSARSDGMVRQRLVPSAVRAKKLMAATPSFPVPCAPDPATPSVSAVLAVDDTGLREACASLFREMVAAALRMDVREIETHKPLAQYGLDSILVVQLTTHFRKLFPSTRSTLFFEVRSIDGLVRHFLENDRTTVISVLATRGINLATVATLAPRATSELAPGTRTSSVGSDRLDRRRFASRKNEPSPLMLSPSPVSTPTNTPPSDSYSPFDVAIIGVSGRYPQAPNLERFWENLSSGRSCVTEIPTDRWRWQDYYHPEKGRAGSSYTRWGGFLDDIDKFDPLFFRIAPKEAKRIDPQERLFLETSYHAIEDSGYTPDTLAPNGEVGVFVGVMNSRYTVQPLYYSIANRVSFLFDFSGPSFAVDSACSSSLTAIHLALDNLHSGMCKAAIAGGVNLILDPQHILELTAVGMLSEVGQCRSFGRNADGFVDAEGVGAVVLKPLAQALTDRDNIHAIIKGSALNSGGRTQGYMVPNPTAQANVVTAALARAGIDSADVSYIEAHGTGTALGDPIEVAGLTRAFRSSCRADNKAQTPHCAIGSLKSNIGHCESASGIAALTKVLLQFRHRQLVPTLHADEVNDEIDFSRTPFRLQQECAAWQSKVVGEGATAREIPRIAGISSFGAGGANAHLVVQEAPVTAGPQPAKGLTSLVPISARTADQLQDKIRLLLAFLQGRGGIVDLQALAYTLQVGREAMDERIVLIAASVEDLQRQLQACLDGHRFTPEAHRGSVRKSKDFLAACRAEPDFARRCEDWIAQRDHVRIAEHWVSGVDIAWAGLYADTLPGRISLPTYPFARERHWIEPQRSKGQGQAAPARHPLLQRNTSTLRYPAYSVELKGDERFLDKDADGHRYLPALLCVEMARAAIAQAYPDDVAVRDLRFEEVALDAPIRADASCEVHIALLPDSEDGLRFEIFSVRDGVECVHGQGRALFAAPVAPPHADVASFAARLSSGIGADAFHDRFPALGLAGRTDRRIVRRIVRTAHELVLEYACSEPSTPAGWTLQPEVLASVIHGAAWLLGEIGTMPLAPFDWQIHGMDAVRFHGICETQGYLVLRCADSAPGDADLTRWDLTCFDALGNLALEIGGLRVARVSSRQRVVSLDEATIGKASPATSSVVSVPAESKLTVAEVRIPTPVLPEGGLKVAFLRASVSIIRAPAVMAKPGPVVLSATSAFGDAVVAGAVVRPPILLDRPDADVDAQPSPSWIDLHALGDGVYTLTFAQVPLTQPVVDQFLQALDFLRNRPDAKVLLIVGDETGFFHGDTASLDVAINAGLYRALIAFPLPTIAALQGDADGAGFLTAALCDFMVCARESLYAFSEQRRGYRATMAEAALLAARFGDAWANDLLYISGAQSGQALSEKGWTFPVVERARTISVALTLAAEMAAKPRESLRLLKQHMADALQPLVERLGFEPRGQLLPEHEKAPAPTALEKRGQAREGVSVGMLSDRVAFVRLSANDAKSSVLLSNLRATLDDLAQRGGHAALVLCGDHAGFLPGLGAADQTPQAESERTLAALGALQATLADYPVPVIVAFEHTVEGTGWLLGLSADACVYGEHSYCSADELWRHPALLRQAMPLFTRRLGENMARQCLFDAGAISGVALAACAGVVARGEAPDVLSVALALAETSPLRSPATLRQWRSINHASTAKNADREMPAAHRRRLVAASPLPTSSVIETEVRDNGVIVVRMIERDVKNMYSPELIRGLEEVFAHIDGCDDYRVVVLTGYDTYFACGGTRESLLEIQQGTARFTDAKIYQLPMSCRLPVIATMQGHAIGGGWTLGMFADLSLFSAESRYISPYMQYGFTPGAGSTMIFPARLGWDLARETLFTAAQYSGSELRAKGVPHACFPRSEVLPRALALADVIASRDLGEVHALKWYFSAPYLAEVEATYARELAMHDKSFVGQGHALQGVMQNFLSDLLPLPTPSVHPVEAGNGVASASKNIALADIAQFLKSLLASELQMSADDVDEDTQFVDLGLDSITGVTWVKKINAQYGTRIEATKVYSHPTLREFCDFVVERVMALQDIAGQVQVVPQANSEASSASITATHPLETAGINATEADLCADLKRLLAQELHLSEMHIDEDMQFVELGLDSITGVTWVRKINATYGTRIEATKIYSYPTLIEFSRYLRGLLPARPIDRQTDARAESLLASTLKSAPRLNSWRARDAHRHASSGPATDAIAVIGIAGQFPRAKNLDEFWRNIAEAKDCIDTVPLQRWNAERYFNDDISVPGTTNSRWMGVLEDCDAFDPLFFNISPAEAESMDPQQRLMLQSCWHAIENAAIDPRSLSGKRCGVFVGCGATDYHQRSHEHQYSTQGFTGAAMSILAARISYFLNLQGPCLSIDTACSSSLVAIVNACDSLVAQNCDMALAGGVAVVAGPMMHIKTGQSGMLSVDGRCFAFDHRANGFVPGEGVGTLMLKRLADAENDGDMVHAVIRGWGMNQDGKTNGITAPNPVSQTRLMRSVYDKFDIDPEDIQLIEAHGTGTKLGDPIEVEGLAHAFRHYTDKTQYCALGSVKGNIGHCLYAAGVAGVLKLVLALKHRQLPPAANFERLNPHIDLSESPFVVNTALKPWPVNAKGGRSAVVSAFGFSGTNAHLVLEAAQPREADPTWGAGSTHPELIPLSAKSTEQLQQRAIDLADFLAVTIADADVTDGAPSLQDIAYTLQVGKEAMEERCALVVHSLAELEERLRAFCAGQAPRGMYFGNSVVRAEKLAFINQDRELQKVLIDSCLRESKFEKLAELWVDSVDLPWDKLRHGDPAGRRPRRVELPLYPFAKERYWLEDDTSAMVQNAARSVAMIHPLVHVNTSTLRQQRYRTDFDGSEFFLRDHRVRFGEGDINPVLPGVAYLEMAAAAILDAFSDSLPRPEARERLVLSNIAWWRPVIVDQPTTVEIELGVDDAGAVVFEIASGTNYARVVHCQGEAAFLEAVGERSVDAALLASAQRGDQWSADEIYAAFGQTGLHYGPTHRGIRALSRVSGKLVVTVALPATAIGVDAYHMHPSVMDSVLQACIGFLPSLQMLPQTPSVPFAMRSLTIHASCPAEVIAVLTPTSNTSGGAVESCDVSIFGADGSLCVDIRGFGWRTVDKTKTGAPQGSFDAEHLGDGYELDEARISDETFYEDLLDSISRKEMTAEAAAELGLFS